MKMETIKTIISLKREEERGKKKVWVPATLICAGDGYKIFWDVLLIFLCDNAKYFLGIDAEGIKPRIIDCFYAAREKHLEILSGVQKEKWRKQSVNYFKNWNPEKAEENPAVEEHWEELT